LSFKKAAFWSKRQNVTSVSTTKYGTETYTFLLEELKVAQLANELQHIYGILISVH